jgi:hypothetical protein
VCGCVRTCALVCACAGACEFVLVCLCVRGGVLVCGTVCLYVCGAHASFAPLFFLIGYFDVENITYAVWCMLGFKMIRS